MTTSNDTQQILGLLTLIGFLILSLLVGFGIHTFNEFEKLRMFTEAGYEQVAVPVGHNEDHFVRVWRKIDDSQNSPMRDD